MTSTASFDPLKTTNPSIGARAAILGASTLTIMAAAIIAPSLPAMAREFVGTPGAEITVRLALTITSLAIAITAPLAGLLVDRIGHLRVLLPALALYTLAGVAGYLITDLPLLLLSRALLGVAVGGIITAVSALITDWFDGARRARFLAFQQAFASLGGVVFLPLAGVLADLSWHAPFLLYAVGVLVLPIALVTLRSKASLARPQAVAGQPSDKHIGNAKLRILGIYLLALVATVAFFMAPTQLPFVVDQLGASTAVTGIVVAGSTVTGVLGALAFPRLRNRLSPSVITALSILLLGGGWLLIGSAPSLVQIFLGALLGGIGVGLVVPNLNLRLAELAAPARRGLILSGVVAAIFLGQFLSPLVVQPLTTAVGIPAAFIWTGAALSAGALAALIFAGLHSRR